MKVKKLAKDRVIKELAKGDGGLETAMPRGADKMFKTY